MKNGKLTVAIVGMGFGSCFLPIYLKHPDVEHVIMVDTNPDQLKALADMYLLDESYYTTDFESVLQNPDVDAVHLVIPPALHAPMSVQVLNAGKHCACTIPMGMSMKELEDVIKARKASGKHYMFMETSVYTREYLYVKELYESGAMGKLQYMRCAHYQDMEGWPSYWDGFPPLAHPTHAIGPCFALAGQRPVSVFGRGSGKVRPELEKQYGCPFAFESALVALEDGETTVEMERFLYHVARGYSECFNIYGENKSFEWDQLNGDKHVMFSGIWFGRTRTAAARSMRNTFRFPIMPICFRTSLAGLPTKWPMTRSIPICPSSRAAVMAVPIRIWSMSSLPAFWKTELPSPPISMRPTGPALVSWPTKAPWKAAP